MANLVPGAGADYTGNVMKSERSGRWLEVRVHAPAETPLRDLIMDALVALTGGAVQEQADSVVAYIQPTGGTESALREVRQHLAGELPDIPMPKIKLRWLADEDWLARWRESLRPRRVGKRFIVAPPWAEVTPGAEDVVIRIEPGMAFGTAEHASTRGALRLLESAVCAGDRVLDVGAGSGILAIAAAKVGAAEVLAVEADEDSARTAHENVERNHGTAHVRVMRRVVNSEWLDQHPDPPFDIILANVLSSVLVPLLPPFERSLAPAGRLLLGGISREEADTVRTAAAAAGMRFDREDHEDEWWTGTFRKSDRS